VSLYDYRWSQEVGEKDPPFYGLLFAMCRKADPTNLAKLRFAFPEEVLEFERRYHAPGGVLPEEMKEQP
jgi:hypothetical protein